MKRVVTIGALLVVSLAGTEISVPSAAIDPSPIATGGDQNRVTVRQLREQLDRSGLPIQYVEVPSRSMATIAGVASGGGAEVGFEFKVFSSSDVATVRRVGRLRSPDFGWAPTRFDPLYRTWVRGVLGNIAYAQYEVETDRQLLAEPARRRIMLALDNALFGAFPRDDAYVHALLPAPQP